MNRTTRVTFSADGSVVDVSLPTSWAELSDKELRQVFDIIADSPEGEAPVAIFMKLSGARLKRDCGRRYSLRFAIGKKKRTVTVSAEELAELIMPLSFIDKPGAAPVRFAYLGSEKAPAVNAQLHGVPFSDYLRLENLYQGFISTHDQKAMLKMAAILYPGFRGKALSSAEVLSILNWLVQLKNLFAAQFPNFFRPAASASIDTPTMLEIMNSQIRALSGGDVTKEKEVFAIDCWRALTELDAKALEAEEFKRQTAKYNT